MYTKTYFLAILIFASQRLVGQPPMEYIRHQPEDLLETNHFTVYKTDTFNLRDQHGMIQGRGIYLLKDSTVQQGSVIQCSHCRSDDYPQSPTLVYYTIQEVFYGQYEDNLMTGVWTCFWPNGKKRATLTYDKGLVQGPVNLYYITGELRYSGIAVANQELIQLKKFTIDGAPLPEIKWPISEIMALGN